MSQLASPKTSPTSRGPVLPRYGTLLGFFGILVLFAALKPGVFLSLTNFRNVLEQVAILAIVSCTMTVVMVVGDFDLSVGSLASLAGVTSAIVLVGNGSTPLAVLAAVVVGLAAGAVNGFLVAYLGLHAFIATLATMAGLRGLALYVTDGSTVFGLPAPFLTIGQGAIGPVPIPVVIVFGVALVCWLALTQTTFGRRWYGIGGNPEAMFLAGIDVRRLRFSTFVVSGVGASLAGVVLTSRLASAHPLAGDPLMLTSIAAVFIGMTMFKNGRPNLPGTLVGSLILGVLNNGLNILQVNTYLQQVLTGGIIILAVLASGIRKRHR